MNNSFQFGFGEGYVLAVEDSLVQAKKLEHFFQTNNITFQLYNNAEDAYAAANKDKPEIIISDIIMPGMNGYEFCSIIKNNPELASIPIILLTSLQDPHDIIKGLQAGADNFITKPYDEKYLLSRIQYLLINRNNRFTGTAEMVIELVFRGQKYRINSDKKQILDLLLSVYEAAIQRNDELIAIKAQLETANDNLLSANSDLEAFTRMVSHDLRSPLNGIIGFSDLLLGDEDYKLNQETKNILKYVNESAWAMSQLINDLLAFARSGTVAVEREPLDLSVIAREIMDMVLARDPSRHVNIIIEPNITAKADPKMIRVVFDNLFGNAFKYSEKTSYPTIRFGKKILYGQTLFYVEDNGAGFDMSKAEKLFQPFQRFHSANDFKGTGVGLSTVKKIIEKHGGQIWAESEPGVGTTFFFTLGD